MKKLLLTIFLAVPLFAFCESSTEPAANSFEAGVFGRIAGAADASEKMRIIDETVSDKRAGAALFFNAANICAQNSDFEKARGFYLRALKIMPDFYLAHRNLGYLFHNNGMHREALAEFAAALALSGADSPKIFMAYGFSLLELKRYDEALTAFEKALMYAPEDENLLRAKARALFETGQRERLYAFAESLVRRFPREPLYWRMLARLDADAGRHHSAAAAIESMRMLGISDARDMELLGDCRLRLGLFKLAAEAYRGLDIPSKKAYEAAKFAALGGSPDAALEILGGFARDSAEYLEIEAVKKDTLDAYEKAYAKNPANAWLALRLGDFYLKEKRFESACNFYEQARAEYAFRSLWGLAGVHAAEGDYAAAAECLERISAEFGREDLKSYIERLKEYASKK